MVLIREVIVTPAQEEHIWTKHRVTPEEAEEACLSRHPLALRGRHGSYAVYGRTRAGRYLLVILYPRGHGSYRLATARDMTPSERRRYQQLRGR